MFGPHETNLGDGAAAFSPRHVAYYQRRAAGGAGLIVTETASVHPSDWPYERAPLAAAAADGWRQIAAACQPHGTLVLAGLGHTGLQGSSAYSQAALWGPSGVPDPVTREVPMEMGGPEISALTAGFAAAAGAGGRGRRRRGGDRRRARGAAPPVPLGPDQPPGRRLRRGPAAADPGGARRGPGRDRAAARPRPAPVLRRAGPLGRGDPGGRGGAGPRAQPLAGPAGRGARRPLLGQRLPARRAHRARCSTRPGPAGPGRAGRRGPGGAAGQRGRPAAMRGTRWTAAPATWSR